MDSLVIEALDELPDDCRLVPLGKAASAANVDTRTMRKAVAKAGVPMVQLAGRRRGPSVTVSNLRRVYKAHEVTT